MKVNKMKKINENKWKIDIRFLFKLRSGIWTTLEILRYLFKVLNRKKGIFWRIVVHSDAAVILNVKQF